MRRLTILLLLLVPRLAYGAACAESPAGQMTCERFIATDSGTSNEVDVQQAAGQGTYLGQWRDSDGNALVTINSDGFLVLSDSATVWDDLRVEPTARTSGTNVPTFSQFFTDGAGSRGVYLYSFDNAVAGSQKEVYWTAQLPHSWAGTDVHVHVHWIGTTTQSSQAVRWGLEYNWAEPLATFGNTTLAYATAVEGGSPDITANVHQITEFTAIAPTANQNGVSSVMIGRVWRDSANAADTYTGTAGLLYIDIHFELDGLGTNAEYTKP